MNPIDTSRSPRNDVRVRKYHDNYVGPYLVMAESVAGNLSITKIAKSLMKKFGEDFIRAMPVSKTKMKILMRSKDAANKIASINSSKEVKFFIPQRLVECLGVAYIEPEVTDEELQCANVYDKRKSNQVDNPEVIHVRRVIKKLPDETEEALYTVIFTFAGLNLPTHVEINRVLYSVKQYVYPVRQCGNCWRLGHHKKGCKSAKRCNQCLEQTINEDHVCEGTEPRCVNCLGPHRSNDHKMCPKIILKKKSDKERENTFSQGRVDWFCAPNSVPTSINSCDQQPKSAAVEVACQTTTAEVTGPSQKRRLEVDSEDDLPNLEVNISNRVCESIRSTVESNEVIDIVADALEVADDDFESRLKIQQMVLAKITEAVNLKVRSCLDNLRL